MKIPNKKLIEILLSSDINPNDLVGYFSVIGRLIKKYGRLIYDNSYIGEISKLDKNIGHLIHILKNIGAIEYAEIKKIIKLLKEDTNEYKQEFYVTTNSTDHNNKIYDYLSSKFDTSKINKEVNNKMGISINGEGWYFKRNLESDLDKILK